MPGPFDEAARLLEEAGMQRLHAQQTRRGATIEPFRTDGCSGGLSDSWQTLAQIWPEFARAVGELPPWESCCTAHDREYWRGESIDGYQKRLQADIELRQCVEQSGHRKSAAIAASLGISQNEVIEVFDLAAELMYQAVRIGGGPCTGLDWRWGHGWPPCDYQNEPVDEDPGLLQARFAPPSKAGELPDN